MGSIELAELKVETSVNIHKIKSQIFFIFAYLRNKYLLITSASASTPSSSSAERARTRTGTRART